MITNGQPTCVVLKKPISRTDIVARHGNKARHVASYYAFEIKAPLHLIL